MALPDMEKELASAIDLLDVLALQTTRQYGVWDVPNFSQQSRRIANRALVDTRFSSHDDWRKGFRVASQMLRKKLKS